MSDTETRGEREERGTILEIADDEVTFRLPGMERREMEEEDRSAEPRDRRAAGGESLDDVLASGGAAAFSPAAPEGADDIGNGRHRTGVGARPKMRRPADWQATRNPQRQENRTWESGPTEDRSTPRTSHRDVQGETGRLTGPGVGLGDGKDVLMVPAPETPSGVGDGAWCGSGAKPVVKPTKYDGSTDLGDYLNHFDLCVKVNGWDAQQAGMFLGLSLAGPARRLLTGRTPATVAGYVELRQALVERFEPTNQEETYKAFLRTRVRRPEEGLQALQEDLMKFTRLAYPEADARTTDTLVLDRFLLCLEPQLRQWVYQTQPRDLQQAVMTAVGAEAYLTTDKGQQPRMRAADATVNEHLTSNTDRLDRLAVMMERLLENKAENGVREKKKITTTACFGCGQEGHFKRECPHRKPSTGEKKATPEGAAVAPKPASEN